MMKLKKHLTLLMLQKSQLKNRTLLHLWTNKTLNILSLELNNKILKTESAGIDNRNFAIKYFLPILAFILFCLALWGTWPIFRTG